MCMRVCKYVRKDKWLYNDRGLQEGCAHSPAVCVNGLYLWVCIYIHICYHAYVCMLVVSMCTCACVAMRTYMDRAVHILVTSL